MEFAKVELTEGNINNDHLYLSSALELFPSSAIGGSNSDQEASTKLLVHSGIGDPVETDIAGDKKIFRKRAWVGEFFRAHQLKAGDTVIIEKTDVHRYHVYPCRS